MFFYFFNLIKKTTIKVSINLTLTTAQKNDNYYQIMQDEETDMLIDDLKYFFRNSSCVVDDAKDLLVGIDDASLNNIIGYAEIAVENSYELFYIVHGLSEDQLAYACGIIDGILSEYSDSNSKETHDYKLIIDRLELCRAFKIPEIRVANPTCYPNFLFMTKYDINLYSKWADRIRKTIDSYNYCKSDIEIIVDYFCNINNYFDKSYDKYINTINEISDALVVSCTQFLGQSVLHKDYLKNFIVNHWFGSSFKFYGVLGEPEPSTTSDVWITEKFINTLQTQVINDIYY